MAAVSAMQVIAPSNFGLANPGQAAGTPNTVGAGAGTGAAGGTGAAANPGFIDYGPKVYGMGAKNPIALPPNPFIIQRAIQVANSVPNVLVVRTGTMHYHYFP